MMHWAALSCHAMHAALQQGGYHQLEGLLQREQLPGSSITASRLDVQEQTPAVCKEAAGKVALVVLELGWVAGLRT
jgi:hypothetical protein